MLTSRSGSAPSSTSTRHALCRPIRACAARKELLGLAWTQSLRHGRQGTAGLRNELSLWWMRAGEWVLARVEYSVTSGPFLLDRAGAKARLGESVREEEETAAKSR
jgi:hypothetical protein